MAGTTITLRLTTVDPVAGVAYSLQDKTNRPVDPRIADDGPISFDAQITLSDDGRLTGPFVRREGPARRFVYIAIGTSAGQHSEWSRRAKIDVHDIPDELLALAREGRVLEVVLPGRARDGGPACATVRPLQPWRAV
ncbi:DUF5990 family protein [Brevundimonas sp.]|jgi:hypothetical protein|uniref:DUF5990 family protein n=1 Tax=Brevundimonas sp. TaxID=1871086 RepID=UPI0037C0FF5C